LLKENNSKYKEINCIDASYAGGKDGMEVTINILN